ncbi:retrovirus-related pol polyprotein from transposon TNT 1-94 [Tanacetum coccineum]|uniref:Retrovirus-related pol polyprotein from transposon TNT 1-94 n=1 Tax=Tanacetum coccineum TaxID=301880 RepID=A0ABQ5J1J9_9ASTR
MSAIHRDDCMSSANLCVSNSMNDVKFRAKSKKRKSKKEIWKPTGKVFNKMGYIWRPTGRTFTIVGNACPLTRITTTNEVPPRKPIVLDSESPKPVVKLVYSRKPRKHKNTESVSKTKVVQIVLWYLDSGCSKHMTEDRSQLTNFISKFLGTVKFGNDQVAKIMGYGDYQIGNVTISRVYYVEGLGHNLFSVGQFCDSNLEVAFRQHTCFIRNLEGVDLLTGSRGDNLYTLLLGNMMASSPICLLSKASKTKSWLWHHRLSHLNFGAINHLARHGLVRGLPKLKFEKDHLCSACALGKSSKKPHKPKSEDTNQEKLYLLHMDLCGPMRVASVNGKKYILVIVDDYSRFTWVKCLRSKDEAPAFIINFLKMIQVRLKETVRRIRTDNGTEFVNQTLREYYEKVGISHETSVARSPQQNGVVERRNRTLIEAARTMLIYAKAPLFLWAEAVATACYTQNRSMIRRRHGKTPYELLHDKPPDLSLIRAILRKRPLICNACWIERRLASSRILHEVERRGQDILLCIAHDMNCSERLVRFINGRVRVFDVTKYGFDSCDPVDTPMVEKSKLDEDKEGKSLSISNGSTSLIKDRALQEVLMRSFDNCFSPELRSSLYASLGYNTQVVLNLSGTLFLSHDGRDISSLAILERVNCVLRISGLYTSRLLDAACKKVLNLLKKGLLKVNEELGKVRWWEIVQRRPTADTKDHMIPSYDVLIIQLVSMKMRILLEPTFNKLMVGDLCDLTNQACVSTGKASMVRFLYESPLVPGRSSRIQRILIDGGEGTGFSWPQDS